MAERDDAATVGGPGWWTVSLAAAVAVASVCCLGHLLLARSHPRRALDGVDVAMGAVMVGMLVGVPLGRGVAGVALVGFAVATLAVAARPVVQAVRGGEAVVGSQQAVLCGAMVVMLVPLASGQHHAMGGTPALAVAAALTTVGVLAVGASDIVGFCRTCGDRLTTGCRLAMGLAAVVMLVGLIH